MASSAKIHDSDAQYYRMVNTSVPRLVLSLAWPAVVSQLITVIYNTADTYFVSQLESNSASGAVGVVLSLMSLIHALGFGIGTGANSLISTNLGEKKDDAAAIYGNSAFVAAFGVGLLITLFGLVFLQPLMRLLGATDTILPYACEYAIYILIGAPIMCSAFVLSNILRAEGEATTAMIGLGVGGVLNVVLDPLLIFNMNMGVSGAAVATLISQTVSFFALLSFFILKRSNIRLAPKYVSRAPRTYLDIVKRGVPTICRQGMASVSSALLNNVAGVVGGDPAIAAMTVANKVYMLIRNIVLGIGQGFQPVAGYNFGAGKNQRVKQAFWFATLISTLFCIAAAIFIFPFAESIMLLFRKDPRVIDIGMGTLRFYCICIPTMAYSTYVNQMYQCLGYSTVASFLASCRQGIFYIPLVLLLPRMLGIVGLQATQPIADLLTAAVSVYFHIRFFKKVLK